MNDTQKKIKGEISETELLKTIEWRLEETIAAFTVSSLTNENCDKNPELHKLINDWNGFWKPLTIGLETTVIVGIYAMVDSRDDCATLLSVYNNLKNNKQLPSDFPQEFEEKLKDIQKRYSKYRNKVYAHTDKEREKHSINGFTYETIAQDLDELKYALKVLWHVHGDGIPDKSSTKEMIYNCDLYISHVKENTSGFLAKLADKAPDLSNDSGESSSDFLKWLLPV